MSGEVQTRGEGAAALTWTPHPLLPIPDRETVVRLLDTQEGCQALAVFHAEREERIRQAEEDPFNAGFELTHWKDADEQMEKFVELLLFIFGGNRAAKSEYAAKRVVETAVHYPGSIIFVLRESEEASRGTVQKYVWRYLPKEIKALNGARDSKRTFKVNYSPAGGFTENKLVLPNGSEIHFANYKQDPGVYEGFEIGVKGWDGRRTHAEKPEDRRLVFNIGFWADENCPLPWMKMLMFRCASRAARGVWTFTAVNGLTPTIKQYVGAAKTLKARTAELLPGKINVEGCPPGTMPYIQVPFLEGSRVIYFHSILNPFGSAYEAIKKNCKGMPDTFTQIRAYGYARDTRGRAFPNFGEVNIIREENLPAEGTNYMVIDPAGRRPIAAIWARVAPGKPGKVYIYRDWPDAQRHGDWAETAANAERMDGDRGPAQQPNGFGVQKYKETWAELERVRGTGLLEKDPYRKRLAAENKTSTEGNKENEGGEEGAREEVFLRLIDSRAARNQHIAEKGGTCLQDQLMAVGLDFVAASGVDVEEGVIGINEWLEWDKEKPLDAAMNAPVLYVSERCRQVIWALQNWTGNDGEKGACKDFVDLVRYLRMEEPRYIAPGRARTSGGGSY